MSPEAFIFSGMTFRLRATAKKEGNIAGDLLALGICARLSLIILFVLCPTLLHGADAVELNNRAEKARKSGNYREALQLYEKALILAPENKSPAYAAGDLEWSIRTFLALTHKLNGNPEKALQLHQENLEFARRKKSLSNGPMNRELDSLKAVAADYVSLRNYPKAIEFLRQAIALESQGDDPLQISLGPAKLKQKLGIVQMLGGDLVGAEKTLRDSVTAFDMSLKARSPSGLPDGAEYEFQVEVLRWLQRVLVARGQPDAALEFSEKGRARGFSSMLSRRLGMVARDRSSDASPTLEQIRKIAVTQNSTLVEYSLMYEYDPDLPLEFSDYSQIPITDIFIWVIEPLGKIDFRQTRLQRPLLLSNLVSVARESIGVRGRGVAGKRRPKPERPTVSAPLRELHQMLIEPIADLLPTKPETPVIFLPQDLLFLVPFAALQGSTGTFLVEKHTIATAPSLQVLELTDRQQKSSETQTSGALVVGNPQMPILNGKTLPDLPGAAEEAKAIATQLGTSALLGGQATKKNVLPQMTSTKIIHLATHGLLDDAHGAFSSLALAPADGDSGFLTAREIPALRIDAELVVLSACDTAQGKITGDGVQGLSRSFIAAGVPSIVVTLWMIPDAPTSSLMSRFYRELKSGANKAGALREAMLGTMREYPAPSDWAAFTLVGNLQVSPTLRNALQKDMGVPRADQLKRAVTRYRLLPVPGGIDSYDESPSSVEGEVDINFNSSLSIDALFRFYRSAFTGEGMTETLELTSKDRTSFQLVFRDSVRKQKLVIQGSDLRDIGEKSRSVSISIEDATE